MAAQHSEYTKKTLNHALKVVHFMLSEFYLKGK